MGVLLGLVFVTPFVLFYALFIRWCDRFEPEPWWLLIVAFFWGAIIATLGGGLGHCTFTAMTGLGFGIAAESRKRSVKILAPLGGYTLAMLMHGTHNGLLTLGDEGFFIMQIVSWLIDIGFFVIIAV